MTKRSKVRRLVHQIVHQLFYAGNFVTYEDRITIVEKLVREFMDQQTAKVKPPRGGTGARK